MIRFCGNRILYENYLLEKIISIMLWSALIVLFFLSAKAAKTRLELVKAISLSVVADLKAKADNAYKDMNDWLGARFLKEMER